MRNYTKLVWLIAMLMTTVVPAQADEIEKPRPADCQLESGASYYLFLSGAEQFLSATGLEPTLANSGSTILFESASDDEWTLKGPNGYLYVGFDFVGCDTSDPDLGGYWYVEKQSTGAYRLRPSKNDPLLSWADYPDMWMGLSFETWMMAPVLTEQQGFIDWYVVAEADYPAFNSKQLLYNIIIELQGYGYDVASLVAIYNTATDKATLDAAIASVADILDELRFENASEEHPYDATARYMRNADLTENWVSDGHDVPGWTMVPAYFCGMGELDAPGFYSDNKTLGSWSEGAFGDNKVYQELIQMRDGKYRLGNYGLWIRHTGEDGDPIEGAYIYAKVGDKLFREPLPDTGWWPGLAQVTFECRTGNAEVGIMFEGTNVGQCVILDFKLEYLGDDPVTERLATLIANSQSLIDEDAIYSGYSQMLADDIKTANELLGGNDTEAQEAHFSLFLAHYETALQNKEAYDVLNDLLIQAMTALTLGDSDPIFDLADYIDENQLETKAESHAFDNEQLQEILTTLASLLEKAKNSVIAPGTDVTDLLINGHFDTTGGWTATMGDFSINRDLHILEKWWGDWKAEQVLTNVPNGTYRMQIQGFKWCSWDWAQSEADWLAGDQTPTSGVTSKIRLNNDEATIQNVWACGPTDIKEGYAGANYYVPDNADRAKLFFDLGLYENTVETTVTDNTLKVEFDCSNSGFWNCFTNLRLTYVGVDINAAKETLSSLVEKAEEYLLYTMAGSVRKAIEEAKADGEALVGDSDASYEQVNATILKLQRLFKAADASIKDYEHLASMLKMAKDVLDDESIAATEAGQELKALYETTLADYNSDYPSLDREGVAAVISKLEELISKAKQGAGFKEGDDITRLIANASFENTIGQDEEMVGGAVHNLPYGWSMRVAGKECYTAQDMYDAGVNSWTAIEENKYTTDGQYSYCLLSAPTPDCYLYQSIKGLPAGTYRVTVDMNVPTDETTSRLTGQRLLVNNVAQYYGKAEQYDQTKLDELHSDEASRTFAGYDELNANASGDAGDMLIEHTLTVEANIAEGESLVLGVRTDSHYDAMNIDYGEVGWDCRGRYKIDNFRLYCVSLGTNGIEILKEDTDDSTPVYNLMGVKVNVASVKGIYIKNGRKYIK